MRAVKRDEIFDHMTYEERRDKIRYLAMQAKEKRRMHLGENLTFLFENTATIRYQIMEMIRAEKLSKETQIKHEIDTYNDLLGGEGQLGCTLLIEYEDPSERDIMLKELKSLPEHIYLVLSNGERSYAHYDKKQLNNERLSSVQFLKFNCPQPPIAIGADHSLMTLEQELSEEQKRILKMDLK